MRKPEHHRMCKWQNNICHKQTNRCIKNVGKYFVPLWHFFSSLQCFSQVSCNANCYRQVNNHTRVLKKKYVLLKLRSKPHTNSPKYLHGEKSINDMGRLMNMPALDDPAGSLFDGACKHKCIRVDIVY